jgi:arsenite methyltransferase
MAELTTSACCIPETQATCCEPEAKDDCCGTAAAGGGCGCSAGQQPVGVADIRETVREKYAAAARAAARDPSSACCGGATRAQVFGGAPYTTEDAGGAPEAALNASLGCGVPTAVADLHPGETVLDLGSGAGADVLISARRVAPTGRAIGLDMTDEMLLAVELRRELSSRRFIPAEPARAGCCECRRRAIRWLAWLRRPVLPTVCCEPW